MLPRRCRPHDVPGECPRPHVEHPRILDETGDRQQQGLVVHVELEHGGVGHVDDRLAGAGKPVGVLGVHDRPGLVESVDERSRQQRWSTLLERATHAEVSVGEGEDRLGTVDVLPGVAGLDDSPRIRRVRVLRGKDDPATLHDPNVTGRRKGGSPTRRGVPVASRPRALSSVGKSTALTRQGSLVRVQ